MPLFALYLLKFSISLALVWLFYQLLLRKLTFYSWNRWYFLLYVSLSLFIPFINISRMVEREASSEPLVVRLVPAVGDYTGTVLPTRGTAESPGNQQVRSFWGSLNGWDLVLSMMAMVACVLLLRCLVRWISLRRLQKKAVLLQDGPVKIYQVDSAIIPFSFGSSIYINPRLHSEKEWEEIILHEYVHVRQRHSFDILLGEFVCAVAWFNPFAWLIRYSMRQNLEFIADQKVLDKGHERKSYQYHLLKVIGQPPYRLANNFNYTSLKKRIIMMNRLRSARMHLVKFLFVLPLLAVLLLAFRHRLIRRQEKMVHVLGFAVDDADHKPLAGTIVIDSVSGKKAVTNEKGFFRLDFTYDSSDRRLDLHFHLKGYIDCRVSCNLDLSEMQAGIFEMGWMRNPSDSPRHLFSSFPYLHKFPANPDYEDALRAMTEILQGIDDADRLYALMKRHPEVDLFYTTEGRHGNIIVLKSGEIERYNYPGYPNTDEMEKKYGPMPDLMKPSKANAITGYQAQWKAVSEEAQKIFHTTNPNVRLIIFPGDSRVLVVPLKGKTQIYDMDNSDPKERGSFESLYGRLPDCIPAPGLHSNTGPLALPPAAAAGKPARKDADTVPQSHLMRADTGSTVTISVDSLFRIRSQKDNVRISVNGVPMPKDWKVPDSLGPHIKMVSVLRDAWAADPGGSKMKVSLIQIITKDYSGEITPFVKPIQLTRAPGPYEEPLYVIDGIPLIGEPAISGAARDYNSLNNLNPNRIDSIQVIKDSSAVRKYGPRARNGVVLIYTKKNYFPLPQDKPGMLPLDDRLPRYRPSPEPVMTPYERRPPLPGQSKPRVFTDLFAG